MDSSWWKGPKFLWECEIIAHEKLPKLLVCDPEIKVLKTDACVKGSFLERLSRFSDWNVMLNTIARIKRLPGKDMSRFISVEEREKAALALIKAAQTEAFEEELTWLNQNPAKLSKSNRLYQLDPILHNDLLRVGGWLRKSNAALELKHPVILPKEGIVTQLILDHCHKRTQHQGRGQT